MAKCNHNARLEPKNKFFIQDDDGDLILIEEIDVNPIMITNGYMELKGSRFFVDYDGDNIEKAKCKVKVQISFDIEDIWEVD